MSESTKTGHLTDIAEGLTTEPECMGWFRFYFDNQCWEWSEGVQRMYGYRPGTMFTPTTDVVLSHKHPDDRDEVATMIDQITHTRGGSADGTGSSTPKAACTQ